VAVGLGILALLYVVARAGSQALVKFSPPEVIPSVGPDPWNLPSYAARSTLRNRCTLRDGTLDRPFGYGSVTGFR
jgi:NitT/TauT family transport system permease protein